MVVVLNARLPTFSANWMRTNLQPVLCCNLRSFGIDLSVDPTAASKFPEQGIPRNSIYLVYPSSRGTIIHPPCWAFMTILAKARESKQTSVPLESYLPKLSESRVVCCEFTVHYCPVDIRSGPIKGNVEFLPNATTGSISPDKELCTNTLFRARLYVLHNRPHGVCDGWILLDLKIFNNGGSLDYRPMAQQIANVYPFRLPLGDYVYAAISRI